MLCKKNELNFTIGSREFCAIIRLPGEEFHITHPTCPPPPPPPSTTSMTLECPSGSTALPFFGGIVTSLLFIALVLLVRKFVITPLQSVFNDWKSFRDEKKKENSANVKEGVLFDIEGGNSEIVELL